ncbi:MAG: DNA ligase [Methylococcales bacterium]|nr:DNA ligase [Methylococcales bacterium]
MFFISIFFSSSPNYAADLSTPALMLAKTYKKGQVDITQYWVSEKLDGVRAYWDGEKLISKQGNTYTAPSWFTKGFPSQPLDGELWLSQGHFQQLLGTVTKKHPIDEEWRKISYAVFDLPNNKQSFTHRLKILHQLINNSINPYLTLIHQYRLTSEHALYEELNKIASIGGEGLMLHHENSFYQAGRNSNILKVKPYLDAEATVIAHISGKGKFKGMLGSILVSIPGDLQFRIGTGFSNLQRLSPPPLGSLITYTYHGKTKKGIPKFASFLRIRKNKK